MTKTQNDSLLLESETAPQLWSVYMVQCVDKSLYTGMALDAHQRFKVHCAQNGRTAKYLRGKAPLKLVFVEVIGTRSEALKIERKIKDFTKDKKIALIKAGSLKQLLIESTTEK